MLPLLEPLASCPACHATDPAPLHQVRNHDAILAALYYVVLACRQCGLIYVGPRPAPERVAAFYGTVAAGNEAWHAGRETTTATDDWRRSKAKSAAKKVKQILRVFPGAAGAAFDYGCGVGHLLDALQAGGWETAGLEPHPIGAVAAERHRMLQAIPSTPSFDLVIAHHVLEHLIDPAEVMRQMHAASRPGGIAFVSVPSGETLPEHGDLHYVVNPIHMNGFTRLGLCNLLRLTGWDVVSTEVRNKKLQAFARRADGPLPLLPGGFDAAVASFRAYARQLDATGQFQGTAVGLLLQGDVAAT